MSEAAAAVEAAAPAAAPSAAEAPKSSPTDNFGKRWAAAEAKAPPEPSAPLVVERAKDCKFRKLDKAPAPAAPAVDSPPPEGEGPLTPSERVAFREYKRKQREKLELEYQSRLQEFETQRQAASGELTFAQQVKAARDSGDPDALAKALGHADFNTMQREYIKRLADPNYMELRQLKEREEQREREKLEQQQQAQRQAEQAKVHAARSAYIEDLKARCAQSSDPMVREMHDDPQFLASIYRVQQEHWDGSKTISPEEAIRRAAKGTTRSVSAELDALYERLHRAKTGGAAASALSAPDPAVDAKTNRSAPLPPASAEPATPVDKHDPKAWRQYTLAKMAETTD